MGCASSLAYNSSTQCKTSELPPEAYITSRQRALVRKTWRYVSGDLTGTGSKVFLIIFRLHPDIKQLFPCRDKEGSELLSDPNFKGHASRFMQAVGAVVDNMHDLDSSLAPLLIGLGRQHVHFRGFVPENFEAFTEAMTMVWSEEMHGRFTSDVEEAWLAVFNFIMMKLKEGFALASENR